MTRIERIMAEREQRDVEVLARARELEARMLAEGRLERPVLTATANGTKYIATFWRSNPQLARGGYETTRTIEAKTLASARKMANEIAARCIYGGMNLLNIERA